MKYDFETRCDWNEIPGFASNYTYFLHHYAHFKVAIIENHIYKVFLVNKTFEDPVQISALGKKNWNRRGNSSWKAWNTMSTPMKQNILINNNLRNILQHWPVLLRARSCKIAMNHTFLLDLAEKFGLRLAASNWLYIPPIKEKKTTFLPAKFLKMEVNGPKMWVSSSRTWTSGSRRSQFAKTFENRGCFVQ